MSNYEYNMRYNNMMGSDVPTWGYIILYLVVIIASFVGNSIFLMTIKKNQHFRRTHHFFLAAMSIRDLIVTIMVIPFVIDSQVRVHCKCLQGFTGILWGNRSVGISNLRDCMYTRNPCNF